MTTTAPARPARAGAPRSVRRLRRLQRTAVALLLVFGALAVTALTVSLTASLTARSTLAQYVRLADARTQALAVQQAANTWAVTPTAQVRTDLDARLAGLAATLAEAAAVPEDRAAVLPLAGALVRYGRVLQDALGAEGTAAVTVLAKADGQLREQLVEPLTAVQATAAARLVADLGGNWVWWVVLGAVLAAGGLVWVQVALARSSRRYLNLGVAGGLLCALISAGLVAAAVGDAGGTAATFATTSQAELDRLATAREQLNQARADELLAVGQRTGSTYRNRWTAGVTAASAAVAELPGSTTAAAALRGYRTAHTDVISALTAQKWDAAAGLVTGSGAAATRFAAADAAVAELAGSKRDPVTSAVAAAGDRIALAIAAVVLLTLLSAALAAWGVARRIEEYR